MKTFAAIAGFLICLYSSVAQAQSAHTVTVGNQQIIIPEVIDLVDYSADPRGQQIGMSMIARSSRLLSMQAQNGLVHRFFTVQILDELIPQSFSVNDFRKSTKYSRDQLVKLKQYSDLGNSQAKEREVEMSKALGISTTNLRFDTPVLVGIERDDNSAFIDTKLIPVSGVVNGKPDQMIVAMCSGSILIKGKILVSQLYAPKENLEWVRSACRRFTADIVGKNMH